MLRRISADMQRMAPTCPTTDLRTHQLAFADRVASINNTDDLAGFLDDVNDWLQYPLVFNFVTPNVLAGFWTERQKRDPILVSEPEREALAEEIRAWRFCETT